MAFNFVNNKIKVFISSRCGKEEENYEILRKGLKHLLEETGFISTYVFEEETSSTMGVTDDYIMHLEESHVILFLIDNKDKYCTEGIMKEWLQSKKLKKKCIVLFCNDSTKEKTFIQEELEKPNSIRWREVTDKKDFIDYGYKAVINDIMDIYKQYSYNKLVSSESEKEKINDISIEVKNQNETLQKEIIKQFNFVNEYFKSLSGSTKSKNLEEYENSGVLNFLKVVLCDLKYTKNIKDNVVNEISDLHTLNKELVLKRWDCIDKIYDDDIEGAINLLEETYEYALDNNLDTWIINDILIDKRNLEMLKSEIKGIYYLDKGAQQKLNNNKSILYYPAIDRIAKEINSNILKEINKANLRTPSTTQIGTNIDSILEKIGEYYICAVYYGSYTHIKLVRELLKETFFNFYSLYEVNEWGFKALKYSILDEDFKMVKHICKRRSSIIATCSSTEIGNLYFMIDNIDFSYKRKLLKLNTFEYLGYYFNEDNYDYIENEIIDIIKGWVYGDKHEYFLRDRISSALKVNLHRLDNQEVIDILLKINEKDLYDRIDKVLDIIAHIDFESVEEKSFNKSLDLVINLINNPKVNEKIFNKYYLEIAIIVLGRKEYEYSNRLDDVISTKMPDFYNTYKLEVMGDIEACYNEIFKFIKSIKNRNETQGKGGVYAGPSEENESIIINIIQAFDIDITHKELLNDLVDICKETLLNNRLPVRDKVNAIKLLIYLKYITEEKRIDFKWDIYYKNILELEKDIFTVHSDPFFDKYPYIALEVAWDFYKIINEDLDMEELLKIVALFNDDDTYSNMKMLEFIEFFIEYSNVNNKYLYVILSQFILRCIYNNQDDEDKCRAIDCMFILDSKGYVDIKLLNIDDLVENGSSQVKLCILYNIKNQKNYSKYKVILEKYKVDNHYIIREDSKKLLKEIEL